MQKKKSAIMQMFYRQRGDCDKIKSTPEFCNYMDEADGYYTQLIKALEAMPDILNLYSKYVDLMVRVRIEDCDAHYAEGFKFGLLVGVEAGESKYGE